ncbi:hypothetical protein BGZ49_010375, partial [Haplosporangium sp. Z 27]
FANNNLLDTYDCVSSVGDVYERDLEANYCKNFSCCGLTLGDLHALLQHYEEEHVRFEEDEDEDDLLGITGFIDDDGWSTHSESAPNSPQIGGSRQLNTAYNSVSAANAAAAATVAALTAACAKNSPHLPIGSKKKSNGVSLSDIYSQDTVYSPDEAVSAFPNSILRSVAQANQVSQPSKKRDLSTFSSSFDTQSPLSKKASTANKMFSTNTNAAAALTVASLIGDIHSSSKATPSDLSTLASLGAQDELMSTVTGYLEQAIQRGLLPHCGEIGSPTYLLAVEELLRKREEIVSIMESIGRPGVSGADKPYRCTIDGCDKAYKNPNGLKYHNQHGHCSMPGSTDDDKSNSKPYRCTFLDCGKCYKNLNGLKYHIEHSHPNLAAALYANIPGLANLEGGNASQAAITAAAAIAAVKGDSTMMSAINAIIASAANNGNRPTLSSPGDNTPDSSPNSSPMLGPIGSTVIDGFRGSENPFSTDITPIASPLLSRATLPNLTLSIQTTLGNSKDGALKLGGLLTPSSLSPTSPKSPMHGSQVSTLTAALAAVAVEQQRALEHHGRSSQGSAKSDYVPSTFIAKQLALEEEARRKKELGGQQQQDTSLNSSFHSDLSQEWPTRDEVLAPGYSAGPLGYELPKTSLYSSRSSQLLNESTRLQEARFDNGAGVGQGDSSRIHSDPYEKTTSVSNLRSTTLAESTPDHSSFIGSSSSGSKGIIRNDRPELGKEDMQKRNSVVRFSSAATEMSTPRPQSPSIFTQGGASPFFSSSHLSTGSGMSNLQSALKENGKVDVLSHRGAVGAPTLNSSLGPALGSVSGTAQVSQSYSSPRLMNSELSTSSLRGNNNSGNGASGSSFFMNLESGSMRQNGKLQSTLGKNPRDEDEDDKDKERYMPAILLSTASGLKGSKIEPFVDGKTEWDSDPFQQAGPSRDGNTRLAPHLIGEDAPPSDTLRDIAQKEKYYSVQTTTLSQFARPNQRFNTETEYMGNEEGSSSNATPASRLDESFDSIITYGFPPEAASYMLNQFRAFGTIVRCETGSYGQVTSESFNWLKIQYGGAWAARNAVSRHLQSVGKFIVGVHACRSFSAVSTTHPSQSSMSMDTSADGETGNGITTSLTDAEAREVEEGVDRLLRMRAQGLGSGSSQSRANTQIEATKARHASLGESWSQGGAALGASQLSTNSMGYSPTRTLNDNTSTPRVSGVDQEDEDMAYILGRSLTSGGSLARSGRGRAFERDNAEFLRSRSTDHSQEQEAKRVGVDGGILSESQPVETGSVGFRPLFGQNEYRGLYASGQNSTQQQQQQSQKQLFEHRQYLDSQTGTQQNNLSLRRPTFGDSVSSDTTLFASSGGVLLDASASYGAGGASSSSITSPFHVQKKQRLSSSLFAPSSVSSSSSTHNIDNTPLNQFGRGRDRSSLLIDDPSLVDQWGAPLLNKTTQASSATTNSSTSGSTAGRTANLSSTTAGSNSAGAQSTSTAPESMIFSVINMAKKRLFWG